MRPRRLALGVFLVVACAPERPAASALTTPSRSRDRAVSEERLATKDSRRPSLAVEHGEASYYGNSLAGHRTASGEPYDPRAFTAAHRTLAFGSVVRVTREDGSASVVVRITDRGPFGSSHRIIDLSHVAAEKLHMIRSGVAEVRLEVLKYGQPRRKRRR